MKVQCQYCGQFAKKVNGAIIYPHRRDLFEKIFYQCQSCNAYVGCHPGTDYPLGKLANTTLRNIRQQAHATFDPIWKQGEMPRKQAYLWLSKQLGIAIDECHIGHFDVEKCKQVIHVCNERLGCSKEQLCK